MAIYDTYEFKFNLISIFEHEYEQNSMQTVGKDNDANI